MDAAARDFSDGRYAGCDAAEATARRNRYRGICLNTLHCWHDSRKGKQRC